MDRGSCLRRNDGVKALAFVDLCRGSCLRRNDGVTALAFVDLCRGSCLRRNDGVTALAFDRPLGLDAGNRPILITAGESGPEVSGPRENQCHRMAAFIVRQMGLAGR